MANRLTTAMLAALTLTVLVGCHGHRLPQGVHREAQPVGGGVFFHFVAPSDGVFYIVDSKRNELFASTSLEAGEEIEFGADEDEFYLMLGMREYGAGFAILAESDEEKAIEMLQAIEMPLFALYFAPLEYMDLQADDDSGNHDHDKDDDHDEDHG